MFMPHSGHDGPVTEPPLSAASGRAPELTLHPHADPRRERVEQCIRDIYAQRYKAIVPSFAPVLVALRDGGDLLATAGYRGAGAGPLYLERYLPAPVDQLIARQAGESPRRESIVEVGHLAARQGGAGRGLLERLGPHLAGEGFRWVVGTMTRELRFMLVRLGAAPLILGVADPAALGDEARFWGTYYEHGPVVLAIDLSRVLSRHAARLRRHSAGGRS